MRGRFAYYVAIGTMRERRRQEQQGISTHHLPSPATSRNEQQKLENKKNEERRNEKVRFGFCLPANGKVMVPIIEVKSRNF